jgi:hypothetical protein
MYNSHIKPLSTIKTVFGQLKLLEDEDEDDFSSSTLYQIWLQHSRTCHRYLSRQCAFMVVVGCSITWTWSSGWMIVWRAINWDWFLADKAGAAVVFTWHHVILRTCTVAMVRKSLWPQVTGPSLLKHCYSGSTIMGHSSDGHVNVICPSLQGP